MGTDTTNRSGTIQGPAPLQGKGAVGPLGSVTSTGKLTVSGAEPVKYKGTETLVGASGTITLTLSGQVFGPSFLGGPIHLTYTITGGTGAYQGATGSGKAVLSFVLPPTTRPSPPPSNKTAVLTFVA